MDLIALYKQCLLDTVTNSREIEMLEFERGRLKSELDSAFSTLHSQENATKDTINQEYARRLNAMIAEKSQPIQDRCKKLEQLLQEIPQRIEAEKQAVMQDDGSDLYEDESSRAKVLEDFVIMESSRFENIDHRIDSGILEQSEEYNLSLEQLEYIKERLSSKFDEIVLNDYSSPIEKVVNALCYCPEFLKKFQPFSRICIYTCWIGIIMFITLTTPFIVIPYCVFFLWSVVQYSKYVNKVLNVYYPFLILKDKVDKLLNEIQNKIMADRDAKIRELDDKQAEMISYAQAQLNQTRLELVTSQQNVRQNMTVDELTASVQATMKQNLENQQKIVDDLSHRFAEVQTKYQKAVNKQTLLQEQKEKLKKQLTEEYLMPKNPGDSKLIPESFFLGFDTEGALVEFDYDAKSTLIEYRGPDSTTVRDLIMMMVVQLLMAMDITCTSVVFVDTFTGGFDYSIFGGEELDSVFSIISTEDEARQLIESAHAEQTARSSKILTKADNIKAYNEMMIQRKSFTLDYRILIFQTLPQRLMSEDKFKQLCKNGPRVGIIPIIFLNHQFLASAKQLRYEERVAIAGFIESLNDKMFIYDGLSYNLEKQSPKYKQILITTLRRK